MTTWKVYKRSAVKQLRIALLSPLALCAALVTAGAANAALPSEYVRIASIGSTGSFKMGEIVVDELPDYITTIPVTDAEDRNYPTGGSKSGVAPLVLTGANNWGGTFTVNEGALIADFGQGLASTDNLVFNGGTYGLHTGSTFNWTIGNGGGETSLGAGASTALGFTAYGNPFAVVADGNAATPIEFGTASSTGFNPAKFVLNDDWATDTVTFKNGISGNNGGSSKPALHIYSGAADAVVEGNVTGVDLYKEGSGRLSLRGANNSFASIYPRGGTLVIAPPEGASSSTLALTRINNETTYGANLVVSNAVITQSGTSEQVWRGGTSVSLVGCTWSSSSAWSPGKSKSGTGGRASFVLDNSNVTIANTQTLNVGKDGDCYCDVVVTNGANLTAGQLWLRRGTVRQYSGTVKATYGASFLIAGIPTCTFEYYLNGGTLVQNSADGGFRIGYSKEWSNGTATGRLYIYPGGTFTANGGAGILGLYAKDTGTLDVRGGTATMTKEGFALTVGSSGTGQCYVSDNGLLDLQKGYANVGAKGTVRVTDGGTVKARAIRSTATSGTPTIVIDGGKVVANAGSTTNDLVYGFTTAEIGVGGATIDTNGQDKKISQGFAARTGTGQNAPTATTGTELAALPAFTKVGAGTLSLIGANDWLCATCVSNGTLAVASGALPATTLRLGGGVIDLGGASHTVANLVGSGVVSNGTLTVTGTVWPGVGDSGTLKIDSTATLNLSTLGCSVAEGGSCGCLEVAGTQNLAGVTVVGEGMENKVPKRGLTLVRAASLVGSPTADASLLHNKISVVGGSLRIGAPPFILIVR